MFIPPSELIINADNSVYHLNLLPGEIADTIITVGDQNRVNLVAQHLDTVHIEKTNREFKTVTGELGGKPITIISTGIGTDNIDIVFNELDALANIDFKTREVKNERKSLTFIRIGTSGAIQEDIPLDSFIISKYALGFDGLLHFYDSEQFRLPELEQQGSGLFQPYAVAADEALLLDFKAVGTEGITMTASGFYGPQSRNIRLKSRFNYEDYLKLISYQGLKLTNLEMETAGIYGLSKLLGHRAISLNAILANRVTNHFSRQPAKTVEKLISKALEVILRL